jgi:hypothetical protein
MKKNRTLELAQFEFRELSSSVGMSSLKAEFGLNRTDGYSLCSEGGVLKFSASSEVEILYAVYDFAETYLGYCFFEPCVDLQAGVTDKIPAGILFDQKKPKLKRRGFIQEFPFNKDSFKLADWMAKNRLNYILTWMKHYDFMTEELKDYFAVRGIEIESGHHNFSYWIPTSKYGDEHPEYFAMKDGVRIKPSEDKNALLLSEQLCTTNPGLRRAMAEEMIAYAKVHPEVKTLSICPNDGFGWCECPECSKYYDADDKGDFYSVSEHTYKADRIYHNMYTDVARQFNAEYPDIDVSFMAYVNYSRPSDGFKLKQGMAVYFAPYWRCINHSIADEECPVNKFYKRDILEWCACREGGEINIYEYFMGVNFYLSLPMIHHELIFDEVNFYKQNSVEGLLTQFSLSHWGVYGFNYYAMAAALYGRDKKVCTKTLLALFGKYHEQYREFYTAMRMLQESVGKCLLPFPRHLFSRIDIAQFENIFELAGELSKDIPYPAMNQRLIIWAEYLLKYKKLFDSAREHKLTLNDLKEFLKWCHLQKDKGVLVIERLDMYFSELANCLKNGKEWVHFGLDWEDQHIKEVELIL